MSASTKGEVMDVLHDLLELEDVHACMVAREGMEGIIPDTDKFDGGVRNVWQSLTGTMDEFFEIIKKYSDHGLDTVDFELGDYTVMFFILPNSEMALVAVIPSLANKGLLEVEMENARHNIQKAM